MTTIQIITKIKTNTKKAFDLSRDIDLHQNSMKQSDEKAIAGKTSGLISLNETVTFKGRHFGILLTHQSQITEMTLYKSFTDEMSQGQFKSFKHTHLFREENEYTTMTDIIEYEVPFGLLGKVINWLILKKYITILIIKRNSYIKTLAENQY